MCAPAKRRAKGRRACSLLLFVVVLSLLVAALVSCEPRLTAEQKMEDFRYLFGILRDNHPYLDLKARVEGYDWLAHEKEFEDAIRTSRTDKDFAKTLQRILLLINNGHTAIMSPQLWAMIKGLPSEMTPWLNEAAKTDAETVSRWYSYAAGLMRYPQGTSLPFRAWYCRGDYVVYWVTPDLASKLGISPGYTIVSVNGTPVHEFVKSLRGLAHLRFDPSRRLLVLTDFLPPYTIKPYRIEFKDPAGNTVNVDIWFEKVSKPHRSPYLPTNLGQSLPNIFTAMLGDGKVAYLHIRQMTSYESSQGESQVLKEFFAQLKDIPALIIDIRGNGGGDDRFWMLNVVRPLAMRPLTEQGGSAVRTGKYIKPFLLADASFGAKIEGITGKFGVLSKRDLAYGLSREQLGNLPPEVLGPGFEDPRVSETTILPSGEYPYGGRVFLLVDATVFSSSEGFAQFCKTTRWATIVGECTGGDSGGSTPAMVTLPNSRIPVFFSSGMGLNPDFTANEEMHTMPDVVVEQSPEDLIKFAQALSGGKTFAGPDPEYDTALRECLRLALEE